ncbi:MAG TPA: hypothetical protein VEA38_01675 [Terriglobales bacterium]|nr:hypothetical protein [Terriglobales bacterium]
MPPEVTAQIRAHIKAIESLLAGEAVAAHPDIDPSRLYTIAEMVELRPSSKQALYNAVRSNRLRETETGGVMRIRGADYIAWLGQRRRRRAGGAA